jgi:DNA-binding NarL/FixJ family response regulator
LKPKPEVTVDRKADLPVRVLIAADSAAGQARLESLLSNRGLVRLLRGVPGISALLQNIAELQPDCIVLDIASLPARLPTLRYIATLALYDGTDVTSLLRAGIRGVLLRSSSAFEILPAIEALNAGLTVLAAEHSSSIVASRRDSFVADGAAVDGVLTENLTAREFEVLDLMGRGLGNREIASRLGISEHTAKFHIGSILAKLGASTRTEAVTTAIRRGWLTV